MKKAKKFVLSLVMTCAMLFTMIVSPINAYAASTSYTIAGIRFKLPAYWKYSKSTSNSTYRYYFLNTGEVIPMMMFYSYKGVASSDFNKQTIGYLLEGMAEQLEDADYDENDIESVKVAGYKGYIIDISGTVSGISSDMRILVVNNPSKKKMVMLSILDQNGNDEYLDDVETIAKNAHKASYKGNTSKTTKSSSNILTASKFESDLNAGKDMTGKKVRFKVTDYAPDSAFGYNMMGGKHLNFVSLKNPHVRKGQMVTVKVTAVENFLGSWIVSYKKI